MIKTKKTTKTQQKQLQFSTRNNQNKENKFNGHENLHTIQTSIKNSSDNENSDSSLELCNIKKPKYKNNYKQKSYNNVNIDYIDLTNESDTKLKDFKIKNEKKNVLNVENNSSSIFNISSSSNESFKSISNSLSDFNSDHNDFGNENNDKMSVSHNDIITSKDNCITPKENHVKVLTESAKLLDRIYGKEWRKIDGVINTPKEKISSDESFRHDNNDSKLNKSSNDFENSFSYGVLKKNKKYLEESFQNEVEDTSLILENINLSDDLNKSTDDQLEIGSQSLQKTLKTLTQRFPNEGNDIKLTSKPKTLKKDNEMKKNKKNANYQQSNEPQDSEAKLSFLSSLSNFTGSMKCDPEADKYKLKFKKNKDTLVSVLFKLFNEEVFDNMLPADLNFKWNARLRSTAGACFNKRSVKINENLDCVRISRIELSSKIIDTAERLRDTLIHELCHAACWIFNGISEGHGPSWKSWANKAMEKFPELPVIKRCHSYDIQTKFTYKCKKCGYSFGRHSKSLNLEKKRCGYCYGEFELFTNKINKNPVPNNFPVEYTDPLKELYKLNDVQEKPKLPKKPSKFALFVKENYGRVKKENPLSKHGEIMKLLGSQFATTKILTPDEIFDKLLDS